MGRSGRRGLAAPRTPRALGSARGMLARPPGTSCRRTKTAGTGRRLHEPDVMLGRAPAPPATQCCGWRKRERKELLWRNTQQSVTMAGEKGIVVATSAQQKQLLGVPRPRKTAGGSPAPPPTTRHQRNAVARLTPLPRCSRGTIRASERVLPVALVLNTDGGWCLLGSHHCRGTRAGMFGCSRRKNSRNFLQPKKSVPPKMFHSNHQGAQSDHKGPQSDLQGACLLGWLVACCVGWLSQTTNCLVVVLLPF